MKQPQRNHQVVREFQVRKIRQIYAVIAVIALLVAIIWRYRHPGGFLGELSRETAVLIEAAVIAGFVFFTASNWRCPACNRYLGRDLNQKRCRKCGVPLS